MAPRSPQWVNTPVLLEALERYEQGRLSYPMALWLLQLLELDGPDPAARSAEAPARSLRSRCGQGHGGSGHS
ncbi:hypothetical protein KBZ20_00985 [Vulcanococcus limneticus Candia 3F8]|uniref:hypothetical protein n=1 Tax=Vulcanococcus limneticus TaxID=2170428 RepID=UPI000D5299E4|nr:hypothetical protein [Vulcanococcus limneticus]MCP9790426.1 hypothetical protein [Vulcanococcus limneticus MW73D5]MCP9892353.1 hypothetical protein [Vulcanococcus limneticus Candia 3F8]MCP9895825.1 hypothetical protein [Vulcanococcus limneticus Candia 3B3]